METICITRGFDIFIDGKPFKALDRVLSPGRVAVLPESIPLVKPRFKVNEGNKVHIGSVLYEDNGKLFQDVPVTISIRSL